MNQTTEASTFPSPAGETAEVATPVRVPLRAGEPLTLVEVFEHVARVHPRPDTLNYKKDGRWLSIPAAEMLKRVHAMAAGLYSLGVRRGDRVAILSESRPEWVLADAGCMFATAIDVPIYPTLTTPQVRYILKDSGARVLMIQNEEKFQRVREAIAECSEIEHVVFFEKPASAEAGGISLTELEEQGRTLQATQPDLILKAAHLLKPADLATIIYTSGTTGEPKGVMLTHENLVSNLIDSSSHLKFARNDSTLSVLPLSHVLERMAMYMYLYHGMATYFGESLDTIGPNLREVRPTIFVGVPRIFEKIFARVKEKSCREGAT